MLPRQPTDRLLCVGFNGGFLRQLDDLLPAASVVVFEEPDRIAAKGLHERAAGIACVAEIVETDYQLRPTVPPLPGVRGTVRCVLAGIEYGVPVAATWAELLGLPGAGVRAAAALRDKLALRRLTRSSGMAGPDFAEVTGARDVADFVRSRGRAVLKPVNRQASVGVTILEDAGQAEDAWAYATAGDEGVEVARRPMPWRYMVEEFLSGTEVSTEILVAGGRARFFNVTGKTVLGGSRPIELGHVVPGPVPDDVDRALRAAADRLIAALSFGDGILHAEWIISTSGPVLVECAGRPPGDEILRLIDLSYEWKSHHALVALLSGEPIRPPRPARAAAIRFLQAPAGRIVTVQGQSVAAALDGVVEVTLPLSAGDRISEVRSSWDRPGWVLAVGTTPAEADDRARMAAETVQLQTAAG